MIQGARSAQILRESPKSFSISPVIEPISKDDVAGRVRRNKLQRALTLQVGDNHAGSQASAVPKFMTQLKSSSKLKLRTSETNISTMICSPGVTKLKPDTKLKTPSAFKFPIKPIQEEDSENEDEKVKNKYQPYIDEFGILGIEISELKEIVALTEGFGETVRVEPKILYKWNGSKPNFMDNESLKTTGITDQLSNFVFPFGCYVKSHNFHAPLDTSLSMQASDMTSSQASPSRRVSMIKDAKKEVKENPLVKLVHEYIIKDQVNREDTSNFFLCFNSDHTLSEEKIYSTQYLKLTNPNLYSTYFCMLVHELVTLVRLDHSGQ